MTRTDVGLRVERGDAPYAMLELEANESGPPLYKLNSYANDHDEPALVLVVRTHASSGSPSDTSSETSHRGLLVGAPVAA